jgi:hypothetical protein
MSLHDFGFVIPVSIVAIEKADENGMVSVIAQNEQYLPTTLTWFVNQDRAKGLFVGQLVEVGIDVKEKN